MCVIDGERLRTFVPHAEGHGRASARLETGEYDRDLALHSVDQRIAQALCKRGCLVPISRGLGCWHDAETLNRNSAWQVQGLIRQTGQRGLRSWTKLKNWRT